MENEVIFSAFQEFCGAKQSAYFLPRANNTCTVHAAYPLSDPRRIPGARLRQLEKLGALCALMMMSGQCPAPFDPLVFHFLVHECNLDSLHEALVAEWHPELRRDLVLLKEMGARGSLTPFSGLFYTYWNTDVSHQLIAFPAVRS